VIAAVGAIGLAGCGANHKTQTFRVAITSTNGVSGFSFGTVTVTQGNKVDFHVDNTTSKEHGFSIDAFGVHKVVPADKAETVSFTPNKTGQFTVYCQLHPTHVPARLIVVG
jgi:plastocyanin